MGDPLRETEAQVALGLEKTASGAAHLSEAAQALDEAVLALNMAISGATDPEAHQAVGLYEEARQALVATAAVVGTAAGLVRDYAPRLSTMPEAPASAPVPQPASSGQAAPKWRHGRASVEEVREDLPPDIEPWRPGERRSGPRQRTHGEFFCSDEDDGTRVISGNDDLAAHTVEVLRDLGFPGRPRVASHVETKVAAIMRTNGYTDATVVINNTPCGGPRSCDTLIPVILPEGSRLTVYGSNGFYKVYNGGAKPPWKS